MTQQLHIIKRKIDIFDFAEQLGDISEACRKLRVSRQHYYDIKGSHSGDKQLLSTVSLKTAAS